MTPHRDQGRGSYLLDRVFPGVGRIKRASGTGSRRVFASLDGMLSSLYSAGRLDVLAALRDGRLRPLVAWQTYKREGPYGFAEGAGLYELTDLRAWAASRREVSETYRRTILSGVGHLERATLRGERVRDLPQILRRYRETAKSRMFNVVRSAMQAYLRDRVGRRDPLYLALADVPPLPYTAPGRRPLELTEMRDLALPQPLLGMAWTMATTGMGRKEYWGRWTTELDRVRIYGTKRKGRDRVVPRVLDPVAPGVTWDTFQKHFKAATGHTTYDLRGTFGHWAELAGVTRSRIEAYMGHAPRGVTDRYIWHEVEGYLMDDGKLMRAFIGTAARRLAVVS